MFVYSVVDYSAEGVAALKYYLISFWEVQIEATGCEIGTVGVVYNVPVIAPLPVWLAEGGSYACIRLYVR